MHELTQLNPIVWAILAVEVAFWLTLASGLAMRYLFRMPRASRTILLCVPLLDLVLIALTVVDLAGGTEPDSVHALAVVYLGFTIGFGHATIAWADRWFAYRFADGPRPPKPPRSGTAYVRRMWAEWRRVVVAWAIALPGLLGLAMVAGVALPTDWDAVLSDPLLRMAVGLTWIAAIWFAAGPVYAMVFRWEGEREDASTAGSEPA
ncbi:hypothetical protein [Agromyces humatus]|uniref:Integral membrane protein n=1 Tax=Agromyces humatus TaxID=279573 RepID=A0ABN2K2N0_9MICO|nr:hypothetical protein [Agromyces humatus]